MKNSLSLLCAIVPLAVGCSGGGPETVNPAPEEIAATQNTLVAEIKLSDSHKVQILENAAGIVGIIEFGGIGVDEAVADLREVKGASLVSLVETLQARAADPGASKIDMARLKTLDEITSVARSQQTVQPELIEKATPVWRNYVAPGFADFWNWWSSQKCVTHTLRCEIGIGGWFSYARTDDYITYLHTNMSTTVNSNATMRWYPGNNEPARTLYDWTVAPWSWVTQQAYGQNGTNFGFIASGEGPIWGWSLTYDNPRTW